MFSYSTGYYVSPPVDQYLKFKNRCSLLFILTANEHILTEFWLQIVEVAITSVGMSVQWLTTDYIHYFTI